MPIKLRKDAPLRKRAVESLRANGQVELAKELERAETVEEALRIMVRSLVEVGPGSRAPEEEDQ